MVAPVDLCNRALAAIGTRSTIASLDEQSPEAAACALEFEATRDELLRLYAWDWARQQVPLAVLKAAQGTPENPAGTGAAPPIPWLYSYAYPADCIRARYIVPLIPQPSRGGVPIAPAGTALPSYIGGKPVRFTVAGDVDANGNSLRVILCNMRQAQLVYTRRVPDANVWDELFQAALVGRLAAKLVVALSGDKTLARLAIQQGADAEQKAAALNGDEGLTVISADAEWMQARGGFHAGFADELD